MGYLQRIVTGLMAYFAPVFQHQQLPGFAQLNWAQRSLLNARALGRFILSIEFSRMLLWLIAWLLASYNLTWLWGWSEVAAVLLAAGGLLWLLPWLAIVRRRHIAALLGNRWE